jgi:hypothetical protein
MVVTQLHDFWGWCWSCILKEPPAEGKWGFEHVDLFVDVS